MANELRELLGDLMIRDGKRFYITIILMIASSMLQGVTILMLVPIMNIMEVGDARDLPFGLSSFLSFLFKLPYGFRLFTLLAFFFAVMSVQAVVTRMVKVLSMKLASGFTADMREVYYDELMGGTWEKYSSENQSTHMDALITQIPRLTTTINYFMSMMTNAATALIDLVIAFSLSASLSAFVIAVGGVFFLFFRRFTKRSERIGNDLSRKYEAFTDEVQTQLSGFKEIRSYGIEKEEEARFRFVTEGFRDLMVEATRNVSTPRMISTIGEAILIAIVFFCAVYFLHIETSRMIVVLYVFYRIWPLIPATQEYLQGIKESLPAYRVIRNVRKNGAEDAESRGDTERKASGGAAVEFDHVYFQYKAASADTLWDVSFSIAQNSITAITGPSGAGKSTVIDLICGFLSPTSGTIGINAGEREIAYVPQNPMILSASVRENIARFHPGIRDEEIMDALVRTEAMGFLMDKCQSGESPLDLRMGDDGVMFSGGEVQRIVLARAVAGTPKMLVLDEATSALDFGNEKLIADLLRKLSSGMTIIIVAHRLSTIQSADDIIIIDNGRLVERGPAGELLKNPESYLAKMKDG
ncbi:MAG: ABC transporter ATP-binding protein [Lachnospiraceae bacterium]|nr:ABC transporter ATP-binding protein [Lachnospiraceae bacterium]